MPRLALALLLASSVAASVVASVVASVAASGCAAEPTAGSAEPGAEDELIAKADEHWFYTGALPALEDAKVTASLEGNTARVTGYLPAGAAPLPPLPHVKTRREGDRTRVDVVYPIATAAPPKTNSRPGTYTFYGAKPYRPDGIAYTASAGEHFVPWGGFPFLGYNDGIAFHGPITSQTSKGSADTQVWYLRRGDVSSGCNRMMGEHVTELAHVLGINMRKVWAANQMVDNPTAATVEIIADYDTLDGKYIDVDYATDVGVVRPAKVHGAESVVMFGSWVATEMPNGKDLPPDLKWEGGVAGKPYVFAEHARQGLVCSFAKPLLPALKRLQAQTGGELPPSLCAKKACIVEALRAGADARARCTL
jgi:hypothetical protein